MQKKVIVLGGASGIGKAIAERFASEGYQVLVAAPEEEKCREVAEGLKGNNHITCVVDVLQDGQLEALRDIVEKQLERFDVLVNSVGVSRKYAAIDSGFSDWDSTLQIMLYGSVKACRRLVPLMNDGGRIIHITSIHEHRVASGSSAYGMAKAAITQWTRSLALELAPRNILANAIAPGFIHTPMSVKEDGKNELESDWFKNDYIQGNHLPLKRAGRPEEVAGVAWFLAGSDASYITGSVITVDGGLTITF